MISLGLDIWAQSDFFGPMKDAGIFLGCKKKEEFFWVVKKVVIFLCDRGCIQVL